MPSDLEDFADALLIEGRSFDQSHRDLFNQRIGSTPKTDFDDFKSESEQSSSVASERLDAIDQEIVSINDELSDIDESIISQNTNLVRSKMAWMFRNAKPASNWTGWQTLMASPPVLGVSRTSQISGTNYISAVNSPEYFNFLGSKFKEGDYVTGIPGYLYATGITGATLLMPNAIEFSTASPEVEIKHFPFGTAANKYGIRVWVDNKLVSMDQIPTSYYNGVDASYEKMTFSTTEMRRFRLEMNGIHFGGIKIATGATLEKVDSRLKKPRVIFMGDSFTEGTGVGAGNTWRGMPHLLATKFDWDVWISGAGGTGYVNPGTGGRVKFGDRIQNDVFDNSPDCIVISGGINDSGTAQLLTLAEEVEKLYTLIDASVPGIPIVIIGPFWATSNPTAGVIQARDIIRDAANRHGYWFIDPLNESDPWINSNNKQTYHPTFAATGVTTLGGGGIASATVVNAGMGYYTIPKVTLTGGSGSGGVVQAVIDIKLLSITVLSQGRGYDNTTTISVEGGGGTGALATPVIVDGNIISITVTNIGSGFTSEPKISINGNAGSGGAKAVAGIGGVVTAFEVLSPGSYTVAPSIVCETGVPPNDPTHPGLWGHGYYAERIVSVFFPQSQPKNFTVNPPPPATGEGEAIAWKNRAIAGGGTVSTATQANVASLVRDLKQAGAWSKLKRIWITAGDRLAANHPLKIEHGNAVITTVGMVDADYSETGATAGYKGDGSTKYGATGFNPVTSGSDVSNFTLGAVCKGTEVAGTSRYLIGNTDTGSTLITALYWGSTGTNDLGYISVLPTGGPSPSTVGARDGSLAITTNGSRSGAYYHNGVLVPASQNQGTNISFANYEMFFLTANQAGAASTNKSTRYIRAFYMGDGMDSVIAGKCAKAFIDFGTLQGWS